MKRIHCKHDLPCLIHKRFGDWIKAIIWACLYASFCGSPAVADSTQVNQDFLEGLDKGDQVLILVHGIFSSGREMIPLAKGIIDHGSGHDKYISFEYRSDLLKNRAPDIREHMMWKSVTDEAGKKLASLVAEVYRRTGVAPDIFAHSQGSAITVKAAMWSEGHLQRETHQSRLAPFENIQMGRVIIAGTPVSNRDDGWKDLVQRSKGVFNFHSDHDLVNHLSTFWQKQQPLKSTLRFVLSFLKPDGTIGSIPAKGVTNIYIVGSGAIHHHSYDFSLIFDMASDLYRNGHLSRRTTENLIEHQWIYREGQKIPLSLERLMDEEKKYYFPPPPPPPPPPPIPVGSVQLNKDASKETTTPDLGGVFLYRPAEISGLNPDDIERGSINPESGQFSLIVKGENVSLPNSYLDNFLSVLHAVYYGDEAPGISIDPIYDGCERMVVRYIGQTRNTPMGQVLFDCDRLMKSYHLGRDNLTGQPLRLPIPGFRNAFELMEDEGIRYLGAWVRFWFIPQEMKLRRSSNAVIFESAKMVLKTEYLFQDKVALTEPSAQAYADFFTKHYEAIAAHQSAYRDLLEYAKMVSIAQYLKESGITLGWLIQSNLQKVPYMETPSSTPALTAEHDTIPLRIYGGVDLKVNNDYIVDKETAEIIRKAVSSGRLNITSSDSIPSIVGSTLANNQPQTFSLKDNNYTVIPISNLMAGISQEELTFHTDFAVRHNSEPGLELIRYYDPKKQNGAFGAGWDLMVPYRIGSNSSINRPFLNILVPEEMVVLDLIHGGRETLVFSDSRYAAAAYVPQDETKSRFTGLFLMSDASFRLIDKLNHEFWFDPAGYLTDMIFSKKHRFHFDYQEDKIIRVMDGGGTVIDFQYENGLIVAAIIPNKGKITYQYDMQNRLVAVVDINGRKIDLMNYL